MYICKREEGNYMVEGFPIPFRGRWVLRDNEGSYIDHDRYRNDIRERHKDKKIEFVGD